MSCRLYFLPMTQRYTVCSKWFYWQCNRNLQYRIGQSSIDDGSNKLTLNVNKTQMIMLSLKKNLTPQNEIILRNEVVQRVNTAKFVGVIVDQHLNWKDHISMISQKISKSCGIIYRIRNNLDIKSKRLIYYNLIHPYLTYCVNVWSSTYRTNLKLLCTAQKRSVRALSPRSNHTWGIFS